MRPRSLLATAAILFALLVGTVQVNADPGGPQSPTTNLGTGFTYQGQLTNGSSAVSGACNMAFRLYDAATAGSLVGQPITTTVSVAAGQFTVPLDFGASAFTGAARWLDIRVKCGADGGFAQLNPRQPITAAPYALYAVSAGAAPYAGLSGVPTPLHDLASPAACSNAQVATWTGSTWTCTTVSGSLVYTAGTGLMLAGTTFALNTGYTDGRYWKLAGNAGATPASFLGTTDNMTLTLAVNGAAALRLVPNPTSPNLIGGSSSNTVTVGVAGATIGGGGTPGDNNGASGDYDTISGGFNNAAAGNSATVGGGFANSALDNQATVGGGNGNSALAPLSTVAGGGSNQATQYGATVGGGGSSTASGLYATVSGGNGNLASGAGAVIGGGGWDGFAYDGNTASGRAATVGGGLGNVITTTGIYATVGGGYHNTASAQFATVGGGWDNTASGGENTVGGGFSNTASGGFATVAGGTNNTASGSYSTVGGGDTNQATIAAATVAGGTLNTVGSYAATVGGGSENTAYGQYATVGGGSGNTTNGNFATVPGGAGNTAAGAFSFAAGQNAHAAKTGSFVWADSTGNVLSSTVADQFLVRASGGITLYTNPGATSGASLLAGSGSWSIISDRNLKANFDAVDDLQVLNALAAIPIQTWNYKTQDASIRHLGPMAQDFHAAFGVGENDTTISTVDAQGVALAAIQGLYSLVQDKDAEIAAQQAEISRLQAGQADTNARLAALERQAAPPSPLANASLLPSGWLLFGALALLNVGGLAGYGLARRARCN